MAAHFACDLAQAGLALNHFWEHTVGSDHAPMALRADWQAQLRRAHHELGFRYVRFHGLLSDDMGTLICHQGKKLYSFFNADQIFDFLLSIGMKPFVELSFMPLALKSGDRTVFSYRGNVSPPRDYQAWATLINKLTCHWVARYGLQEVRTWFFEVWNEPNLAEFWSGTQADYFKLYRCTVEAIKAVDASLQVGGPATAKNAWIAEFVDFGRQNHVPIDFISTHHYPTDAFGEETDDTETQLSKSTRGILREQAKQTAQQAQSKPVYYTEWNASSNPRDPLHDEPYAAAFVVKTILEANGLVEAYSFWTFSDIFEENYFPSQPFHGGFGLLTLHGVAKPTYRAFQLLHHLGREMLTVTGSHETVDTWLVRDENSATLVLTNHALPRHPIHQEQVHIELKSPGQPRAAYIERIDADHANAKKLWREMGQPDYLTTIQLERLQQASEMNKELLHYQYGDSVIHFDIELPPHAVAAVTIRF